MILIFRGWINPQGLEDSNILPINLTDSDTLILACSARSPANGYPRSTGKNRESEMKVHRVLRRLI